MSSGGSEWAWASELANAPPKNRINNNLPMATICARKVEKGLSYSAASRVGCAASASISAAFASTSLTIWSIMSASFT